MAIVDKFEVRIKDANVLDEETAKAILKLNEVSSHCDSISYVMEHIEEAWISECPDKESGIERIKLASDNIKKYCEVTKKFMTILQNYSEANENNSKKTG